MNAYISSSVKAHPQIQLYPLLVLCSSHSNKDLSDPVFELLQTIAISISMLSMHKTIAISISMLSMHLTLQKSAVLYLYKIKLNIIFYKVLKWILK